MPGRDRYLDGLLVLLHHKFRGDGFSDDWSRAAWTSRHGLDERDDQSTAHGGDRVGDV